MAKKPRKMTEDELVSQLNSDIEATGYANTELSNQREESMKYYLGEKFGNEIDGRSEIVTTDVRDTVEYIMPSLMRIFNTSQYCRVRATRTRRSKWHNKLPTTATMYYRQNNRFKVLYDAFKDALISKTGVIKHFWEERRSIYRNLYKSYRD